MKLNQRLDTYNMKKNIFFVLVLLLASCEKSNKNFEVLSFSNSFEHKEEVSLNSKAYEYLSKVNKNTKFKSKKIKDAHYLNLGGEILNKTGQKLEYAILSISISVTYENDNIRSISAGKHLLTSTNSPWDSNETKNIDFKIILNNESGYTPEYFIHEPKKVKLILYLGASNSIGFDNIAGGSGPQIFEKDITDTWNF